MKNLSWPILALVLSWCSVAQAARVWVEAETGGEFKPIVVKSDKGASGSIYLASWKYADYTTRSTDDGLVTFEVYIPQAGDYRLWAHMRLPWSGMRPYDISRGNGDPADASQWTPWLADSRAISALQNWGWSNSGYVKYFAAGMHTLHLIQREGGPGVNLDKILLTNEATYVPTGLGEAEATVDIANPYKSAAVGKYGQLRLVGNKLSDKNGSAVQLQGISAHGLQWFPLADNQTIPYAAEFFGAEVVRLAMYIEDYSPTDPNDYWGGYTANKATMLARTEAAIEDAVNAGVYVLVDWHIHNIPSNYTAAAVEFYSYISSKYGHLPNVIYEICNEPVAVSWSGGIKPYANTVISAIRKNDPDNIVIVGTPNWSQDVDIAANDPLSFSNVMYAMHFYAATHDINVMKNKVQMALNAGLAVFVSEWGTSDVGTSTLNLAVAQQWMEFMNLNKLSWVSWSLGNKDESSSILHPLAPLSGPWASSDLTETGRWLKPYFDAPQASTGSEPAPAPAPAPTTQTSTSSANVVIEAERYDVAQGIQIYASGTEIGYFDAGDHFGFRSQNLDGLTKITLRMATATTGGVFEIRTGSPTGSLLSSSTVTSTGGWNTYIDVNFNVAAGASGIKDLYFVGKSGSGIFKLDRLTLVKTTSSTTTTTTAPVTAKVTYEGERSDFSQGITVYSTGTEIGYFDAGDYFGFRSVKMDGLNKITVRIATATAGGVVEFRAGGVAGTLLASMTVQSTGGWNTFIDVDVNVSTAVTGLKDLYVVGKTGTGIFKLDRLTVVTTY